MFCFPANTPNLHPDHPITQLYRAQQIYRAQAQYFADSQSYEPSIPPPSRSNNCSVEGISNSSRQDKLDRFKASQRSRLQSLPKNVRREAGNQIYPENVGAADLRSGYFNRFSDPTAQIPCFSSREFNPIEVPTIAGSFPSNFVPHASHFIPTNDGGLLCPAGIDVPGYSSVQHQPIFPQGGDTDSPQRVREYLQSLDQSPISGGCRLGSRILGSRSYGGD